MEISEGAARILHKAVLHSDTC